MAEEKHHSTLWLGLGIPCGFFLPIVGNVAVTAAGSLTKPEVKLDPTLEPLGQDCYRQGYIRKAKIKNMTYALCGSILGTATLIVVYFYVFPAAAGTN